MFLIRNDVVLLFNSASDALAAEAVSGSSCLRRGARWPHSRQPLGRRRAPGLAVVLAGSAVSTGVLAVWAGAVVAVDAVEAASLGGVIGIAVDDSAEPAAAAGGALVLPEWQK